MCVREKEGEEYINTIQLRSVSPIADNKTKTLTTQFLDLRRRVVHIIPYYNASNRNLIFELQVKIKGYFKQVDLSISFSCLT